VKPQVALEQLRVDREASDGKASTSPISGSAAMVRQPSDAGIQPNSATTAKKLRRFHATVDLSPTRIARDAGEIGEAIIQHLASLVDAKVTLTLEIQAAVPNGVPENVVRTVSENARTLKFIAANFEEN